MTQNKEDETTLKKFGFIKQGEVVSIMYVTIIYLFLLYDYILNKVICINFRLPNGHINFEKFWQLAKQVTEFITWKQVACPFEKNSKVITFLQANPVLTENGKTTILKVSLFCKMTFLKIFFVFVR